MSVVHGRALRRTRLEERYRRGGWHAAQCKPRRAQSHSLSRTALLYQQPRTMLSLSFQAKVLPRALLPLEGGSPPLQQTVTGRWHPDSTGSGEGVKKERWFWHLGLLYTCLSGSPASAASHHFFSATGTSGSASPPSPAPHAVLCCGVFSAEPWSGARAAAQPPAMRAPSRAVQAPRETPKANRLPTRGLLFVGGTWCVTDGCLSKGTDHQLTLNHHYVLVSSLSKRTFLCLIPNHL